MGGWRGGERVGWGGGGDFKSLPPILSSLARRLFPYVTLSHGWMRPAKKQRGVRGLHSVLNSIKGTPAPRKHILLTEA